MRRTTENYDVQQELLPGPGRFVVAGYDEDVVTVYQAYRREIADYAVEHQRFGGPWSFGRMSWIKPGFMWMMYRSGWASKEGQEHVLAIHLQRAGFDEILRSAVNSSFTPKLGIAREEWAEQVARSDVRLQWDPDHDPSGRKLDRRAIQLGLRGETLRRFALDWTVEIEDITPFVREQKARRGGEALQVPVERVYPVGDDAIARLGRARILSIRFTTPVPLA